MAIQSRPKEKRRVASFRPKEEEHSWPTTHAYAPAWRALSLWCARDQMAESSVKNWTPILPTWKPDCPSSSASHSPPSNQLEISRRLYHSHHLRGSSKEKVSDLRPTRTGLRSKGTKTYHNDPLTGLHAGGILRAHANIPLLELIITIIPAFPSLAFMLATGSLALDFLDLPNPDILAALRIPSAVQTVWPIDSPLTQDTDLDGNAEFNVSNDTVSALVLANTSTASPKTELPQDHGISPLKDLGVRDSGVRHVRVDTTGALPVLAGTTSPRNGLVVPEALGLRAALQVPAKSECQVVAVALTCGAGFEALEHDVRHALAGQHIPTDHRGLLARAEETTRRDAHVDGFEASLIQRNILVDETSQTVNNGRIGHGLWGVNVPIYLGTRAFKVEDGLTLLRIDCDA